jgi:hypothetical protein
MPQKRRRWPRIVGIGALAVLTLVATLRLRSGIDVTIINAGKAPIHSVDLLVTGNTYPLGDIASGVSRQATVKSRGESSLKIHFIDDDGNPHRLDAGVYIEPGYRGSIEVSIKEGQIVTNEQRIDIY